MVLAAFPGALSMAAGSSSGDVGIFDVTPPSRSGEECSFSGCRLLLRGGHSDVRPVPHLSCDHAAPGTVAFCRRAQSDWEMCNLFMSRSSCQSWQSSKVGQFGACLHVASLNCHLLANESFCQSIFTAVASTKNQHLLKLFLLF